MIKGARKQMIVIRMGSNRYFDEAYFVLSEDAQRKKYKSTDILSEANRILSEVAPELSPSCNQRKRTWLLLAAGGLCGFILSLIGMLLLL